MYGRFHSNPGETPPVSLNRKPYLNRRTLHNTKKQRHHDLPCPPASSGFKFKGKCDRHTSRDCALPAQHGNAFFKCLTNYSLRRRRGWSWWWWWWRRLRWRRWWWRRRRWRHMQRWQGRGSGSGGGGGGGSGVCGGGGGVAGDGAGGGGGGGAGGGSGG